MDTTTHRARPPALICAVGAALAAVYAVVVALAGSHLSAADNLVLPQEPTASGVPAGPGMAPASTAWVGERRRIAPHTWRRGRSTGSSRRTSKTYFPNG